MDFLDLQAHLRAVGSDPHLAWSPRHDDLPATTWCRGAWNLLEHRGRLFVTVRDLGRPERFPPDTTGPEPVEVADEAEGCALLRDLVTRDSPPGGHRLLPTPDLVSRFADATGTAPRPPLFGTPFSATAGDSSWWVAEVDGQVELRARSTRPAVATTVRRPVPSVDDARRLLLLELATGDRHRRLGDARVGLPRGLTDEQRLARVSGASLEDLARGLLSERGDGVVDVLAEPVALHLITPDLAGVVEERTGWPVDRYGDGRSAHLGGNGSTGPRWTLREDGEEVELLRAEEHANPAHRVLRSRSLAQVQARLLVEVGFHRAGLQPGRVRRYLTDPGTCTATPSVLAGVPLAWAQREPPVDADDSGWRFFSVADVGDAGPDDGIVVDVNAVVHAAPTTVAVYLLPVGSDLRNTGAGWWDIVTRAMVDLTR